MRFFFLIGGAAAALLAAWPVQGAPGPAPAPAPIPVAAPVPAVELGIDVVERDRFALFRGKRVGLVTNQTGVDGKGRKTRAVLAQAPGVRLVKLFSPEHGIDGTILAGKYVASRKDPLTGLPVYSLYDDTRKPTPGMLSGLDMLVFDLQDIGCRSYTYVSTMIKCMEAAGENGIEFVVLDRPNPLGGLRVEGPMVERRWISFVGQIPVPYVHGLTVAEAARMANDLGWTGAKCRLTVVPMRHWTRGMTWQDTGLEWVQTSPNIPNADSPVYYVTTGLAGSLAGLNIGIGTGAPFQMLAAPGLSAATMSTRFRALQVPGLSADPFYDPLIGWQGVRLQIDPHTRGNLCAVGVYLLAEANRTAHLFRRSTPSQLNLFYKVYGSAEIRQRLEDGESVGSIVSGWTEDVARFKARRAPYLLYQ